MKPAPEAALLPHRYRFDNFELQPAERRLLVDGQPALLGARAFDVLMALVEQRGRIVTKGEILAAAWPGMVVEENNLAVQISTLRKLLGPRLITTVAGRGYQFTGELLALTDQAPLPPAEAAAAPHQPALIGRDNELQTLAELLHAHRLVTVVGTGGIGKTSLAQAWRQQQQLQQPEAARVAWVELAALTDALQLPAAVLAAAGHPAGAWPAALLGRELTLVLDNAEPWADAVARLVQELLTAAPHLRVLVTSQVPLRLQTEQVYRLGTLPTPAERVNPAQAMEFAAVQMFVQRACAAEPQFTLTAGNVAAVVEICRRLDGLPLALELAAARVPALGVIALAAALDQRLRVLGSGGSGNRAAPARQRTLRAALQWSHDLLDANAKAMFRQLGAFSAPFTLQQAQAVADAAEPPMPAWAVLDALGTLVDGSLVNVDGAEPPRYTLLESARLFALEMLQGSAAQRAPQQAPDDTAARLLQHLPAHGLPGVDQETVIALARRYRPDDVRNFDSALKELERAVDIAGKVVADSGQAASDAFVGDVLAAVAEQTRAGDFDGGTDAVDEALAELDRRQTQQQAALRRSRQTLLQAGVQQDLLRRDAFAVARRIEALAAIDEPTRPLWTALFRQHENRFLQEGAEQGIALSLAVATEMARRRLAAAASADERRDARRALGHALQVQGDRDSGSAALQEAVAVCREALAETERHAAPLEWAALQHELAGALRLLGVREANAPALEEAVRCCQDALKERTRARAPLDWAASQHSLGECLRCLGARDNGSARLAAAAQALRESLKERTRARAGLDWGRTQNALGIALSLWARREPFGSPRRHEAVAAYREALQEVTRERAPKDWAGIQNNLGIELAHIGELEDGVATLQDAVAAYREALRERTRADVPSHWAITQHNLGGVLRVLGDREAGTQSLRESVQAFHEALKEHTRERLPLHWAAGKTDLGVALRSLGQREEGCESLEEAARVLREALLERTRASVPMDWALTQGDLALTLLALGERRNDAAAVRDAQTTVEAALEVLTRDATPGQHAEFEQVAERARAWLTGRAAGQPQLRVV